MGHRKDDLVIDPTPSPLTPRAFAGLVADLLSHDVELPGPVLAAAALHTDVESGRLLSTSTQRMTGEQVLAADLPALADEAHRRALAHRLEADLRHAVVQIDEDATAHAASTLATLADEVLDQLSPRFDQAAAALHAAASHGIQPGATAATVIDLAPGAIAAWRDLPRHVRVLDDLADVRIRMTELLQLAPFETNGVRLKADGWATDIGACFHPTQPWHVDAESSTDRWLRLSGGDQPARLLSIRDSASAAETARAARAGALVVGELNRPPAD